MMFSLFKGWLGERATQLGMWMKLDSITYNRFHNLILNTPNGTTQIDHVLLSRFGVFVIETKNYNGWIFGNENQKSWTQVLHKTKHTFQNPLHQNYRHTKALSEQLNVELGKIHSIVFFIGDAKLKTILPANVMTSGLSNYIRAFNRVVFSDAELARLEQHLARLHSTSVSSQEHVHSLRERHSSTTICPKCGSPLIKRIAKRGPQTGTEFWGCSGFPSCKYIKKDK
jgi:restriction system protein